MLKWIISEERGIHPEHATLCLNHSFSALFISVLLRDMIKRVLYLSFNNWQRSQ